MPRFCPSGGNGVTGVPRPAASHWITTRCITVSECTINNMRVQHSVIRKQEARLLGAWPGTGRCRWAELPAFDPTVRPAS
jgi:hypothetical protein